MPARVDYTPYPTVEPRLGGLGDGLQPEHIAVDANKFGGQIGEAMAGRAAALRSAGSTLGQASSELMGAAVQQQGMINETLAANAETDYATKLGKIIGDYKSKQGLDAATSLPKTTSDIQQLRQQMLSTLPNPASAKAFNLLAGRRESYALQDINSYSAQQIKKADYDSAKSGVEFAVGEAGDLGTAQSDARFGAVLGDIQHNVLRQMQNLGWGTNPAQGGMSQDQQTGEVNFDETTDVGKQAKQAYRYAYDSAVAQAWENRLHVLADRNVTQAYQLYQRDRDKIPGVGQVRLDAFFTPKVRDVETRSIADGAIANAMRAYSSGDGQPQSGGQIPSNLGSATKDLGLTQQEQYLYQHHLDNLHGGRAVENADGSRSTAYVAGMEVNGREYNIPTIWDGKKLTPDQALERAKQEGLDKFPSYATADEAAARYDKMHDYMARDLALYDNAKASASGPNPNNLGNVKTAAGARAGTQEYVQPASPTDGVILAANNLRSNYQGMTLAQIGQKWAQNDLNWVKNVSAASGIKADEVPNLNDPNVLKSLLTGIATAEKSPAERARFGDDVLRAGVQASLDGKQAQTAAGGIRNQAGVVPQAPFRSLGDFYRSNYDNIVESVRTQASKQHPDDPQFTDAAVARVEQRMSAVIRQQDLSHKADSDLVMQAFNGDLSKGQRPISIDQMTAINPQVKQAWDRMQVDNPQAALAIETRIMTANAKATDKDLKEYGSKFYDLFRMTHADSSDPNRITSPTQLYKYVGPGGELTIAGLEKLTQEISGTKSPEAAANAKMVDGAFAYAKHQLTFSADYGSVKVRDPNGEDIFNAKFIPAFFDAYKKGIDSGKTPYQLLSKDSPDFIVDKIISAVKRSPAEVMRDQLNSNMGVPGNQEAPVDLTTADGVKRAVWNNQITLEEGKKIAREKGWIQSESPTPPGGTEAAAQPEPHPPIAQ